MLQDNMNQGYIIIKFTNTLIIPPKSSPDKEKKRGWLTG